MQPTPEHWMVLIVVAFLRSNTTDTASSKITFDAGIRLNDDDLLSLVQVLIIQSNTMDLT